MNRFFPVSLICLLVAQTVPRIATLSASKLGVHSGPSYSGTSAFVSAAQPRVIKLFGDGFGNAIELSVLGDSLFKALT